MADNIHQNLAAVWKVEGCIKFVLTVAGATDDHGAFEYPRVKAFDEYLSGTPLESALSAQTAGKY